MRLTVPLAAVLLIVAGAARPQQGQGTESTTRSGPGVIQSHEDALVRRLDEDPGNDATVRRWLAMRHVDAMVELVEQLPPEQRPQSILYLAGGSHLAPLGLCELLPDDRPCTLASTDVDPATPEAIADELGDLSAAGAISDLTSGPGRWSFRLAGHPVDLSLRLVPPGPVPAVEPSWLASTELVISHDWSGDPLENLRVVYGVLRAARSAGAAEPPMLMIEDLERHPYPIDLAVLAPVARTGSPYGHRGLVAGTPGHGSVELGPPVFGGAVLLALSDPWWRKVSADSLQAVLDLMVFNEFLDLRRNVLEGGNEPLLAPALLDWWTGFGTRTVDGGGLGTLDGDLADVARSAWRAAPAMTPANRRRLACRLQVLRALAHALAAGADVDSMMPTAKLVRRPEPGSFPNPEMESAYRESLRHVGDLRAARDVRIRQASRLADALDSLAAREAAAACPVVEPAPDDDPGAVWTDTYSGLKDSLSSP